jgi:predicted oxidoreductase
MDILNLPILFKNALKLNEVGVSNNELSTYKMLKNQKELILVTNEIYKNKLVMTSYRKN